MKMWWNRHLAAGAAAFSTACATPAAPTNAPVASAAMPMNAPAATCGESTPLQKEAGEVWPETVAQAAEQIVEKLAPQDREIVRSTPRDDLIRFHHGWGTGIRNGLGLWRGNDALLADCGCVDPDGCSMQIIEAVWERLQSLAIGRKSVDAAVKLM